MKVFPAILCFLMSCATLPAADGIPVVQTPVAGGTLSCKGSRCCWPWTDHPGVVICVEPTEGNYLGIGGVMFTLRSKMP